MRRLSWTWLAALLAPALLAGCENDRIINIGALNVTPGALAFGPVDVGLSVEIRVDVLNASRSAVAIPTIKIANDPNAELTLSDLLTTDCKDVARPASPTLAAGECARFSVTWAPLAAHPAVGTIEIDPSNSNNAILLPVSGLGISTIFPLLRICALDPTGAVVDSACSALGAHPPEIPTVDFGNGVLNTASVRTVRLFNDGQSPLLFSPQPALPITDPTQFSLAGSVPGGQLDPGASADLTLTGLPTELGTLTGELDIASNDPRVPFAAVPLQLATTGIAICVEPDVQLPFGLVLVGSHNSKSFTLTNCGMADVAFASTAFAPIAPTTDQFSIAASALPPAGQILHPNDQLTSAVTYSPTAAESDLATLDVSFSNNFGISVSHVGLSGSAVATFCGTSVEPTPVANIATGYSANPAGPFVAFDAHATPSPVAPLDYVQLDGSNSIAPAGSTFTWTLVSQPTGSTTTLQGNSSVVVMQTLVSGAYVVELSIADSSGCTGKSQVTIEVVPTGDIHIELVWAEDCGDVDLHYLGPGGLLCTQFDTAYYNTHPDWGCATENCGHEEDPGGIFPDGTRADDPTLDHDDQWGFGPENVTQQMPFDSPAGSPYQIWVHYFSAVPDGGGGSGRCGTTHPTINVYLGGVLANTFTLTDGLTDQQTWHAADLAVANQGSAVTVTGADTMPSSTTTCGGNDRSPRRALKQRAR